MNRADVDMEENIDLEELIITATRHPDPEARRNAIYFLGMIGDPLVAEGLISALRDANKSVRAQATMALPLLGIVVIESLCTLLKDRDWRVRYRAAEALGILRSPAAESPLIEALSDEKDHVRYMAAKSLGRTGGKSVVTALIPMLKDQNEFVRRSVAITLGRLGDPTIYQPFVDTLTGKEHGGSGSSLGQSPPRNRNDK